MDTKRLWVTIVSILFALSVAGPRSFGAWAQTKPSAACPAGWEWNRNSIGQDPCALATVMECGCRSVGIFTISPLNATYYYNPPKKTNKNDLLCDCNTVMYSLYNACASCQGAVILPWPNWITQCDSVSVAQYPFDVPFGTAVPRWAYYNVTTLANQTYSDTVAISVGRNPEATPKSSSTYTQRLSTTPNPTSSSSSRSLLTSTVYPTQTSGGSSNKNTGAIIGGVVGGVVPLIILAIVVAFYLRRRGQSYAQNSSEYYREQATSPTLTAPSLNHPYGTYHTAQGPQGYTGMPET